MRIKYKLMLAMDALMLLAIITFGGIVYTSERALLQRQARESMENTLETLSKVTSESILGKDSLMLINYTEDLKRIIGELELAYVTEGDTILAHTDSSLAPKQLPLSSGQKGGMRGLPSTLMVRRKMPLTSTRKGITFSSRKLTIDGRTYDVVIGYSNNKLREKMEKSLSSSLLRLLKAGGMALLAALLLALWIAGRMTRPIAALVGAFSATGEGNLDFRLKDTSRRDEVGILNREFNRMGAKLKELDELKKDFTSSVTHELKSPLGAIESYLDLMSYEVSQCVKDPSSLTARMPRFLENISFIKQNSGRLLRFISDLLDSARIEKGKFEILRSRSELEPLIQNTVKLFSERAKSLKIDLRFAAPAEKLPQILLDPERITQVLANLVSNALKFTPGNGSVIIRAEAGEKEGRAGALKVTVEDTGSGITQEDMGGLFGKFFQATGSRGSASGPKGTGLGLYIVKSIVEAHGGKVFAESSPSGSRFGFELPLNPDGK